MDGLDGYDQEDREKLQRRAAWLGMTIDEYLDERDQIIEDLVDEMIRTHEGARRYIMDKALENIGGTSVSWREISGPR